MAVKVVDLDKLVPIFQPYGISCRTLEANLRREVQVMGRLSHPNIVRLEDSFWYHRSAYICMELVEGKSLIHHIPPGGMHEDSAKAMFYQICSAVAYCHAHQVREKEEEERERKEREKERDFLLIWFFEVIHGDIKLENILIRSVDRCVKLIDFGFSHIVVPGEILTVSLSYSLSLSLSLSLSYSLSLSLSLCRFLSPSLSNLSWCRS